MNGILQALGAGSYLAHSLCLTNDPVLIGLYVFHDMLIFVSYMVISTLNFLTKGSLSGPSYVGFSAFILFCGISHLTKTMVIYAGVYRLDVMMVVATGWISATTAIYTAMGYWKWRSIRRSSPQ